MKPVVEEEIQNRKLYSKRLKTGYRWKSAVPINSLQAEGGTWMGRKEISHSCSLMVLSS
jgi:hypothetical protein